MSDTSKVAVLFAQLRGPVWSFALLPAFISFVVPATAWGDIYKWTDERGRTYYSDSPPPTSGKANIVQVVQKEIKPTPAEQALLARIERLERQQQAQQDVAQAPAVQPPMPYGGYSSSTPPPSNYYDSGYDGSYYPGYYSSYYPSYRYSYPVVPAYSYAVYPRRTLFARPAFVAQRSGFAHAGGGRRGRR